MRELSVNKQTTEDQEAPILCDKKASLYFTIPGLASRRLVRQDSTCESTGGSDPVPGTVKVLVS